MSNFTARNSAVAALPKPIKGRGLTNPGVVILQFLLILLFETFEYSFTKVGVLTGFALIAAELGAIYLGRPGTSFAAVVNPPIAYLLSTLILLESVGSVGVHITRFGIEFISALASEAPYLILGALIGWSYYFWEKRSLTSGA